MVSGPRPPSPEAWERQRRTFERGAQAYDRARPTYPVELAEQLRAYADLAPDDRILEVGCGSAKLTSLLAEWGNPILAIDPSAEMIDVSRAKLGGFEQVELEVTRLEDLAVEDHTFGMVCGAQTWHWLDPDTRVQRWADLLYRYGTAAVIGNIQVNPPETLPFFVRIQDVYREIAPANVHKGEFRKPHELPSHPLEGSDLFVDHMQLTHAWDWTLPTDSYIALMRTHSPHAALEPDVRERLEAGLVKVIDEEFGGAVTEHYVAVAGVARRT